MIKRIFNKSASRGMAVLMAAAMVGTISPVSLPTQPTWTVQAATATQTVAATAAKVTPTVSYVNEKLAIADNNSGVDTFYYAIVTVKDFAEDNVKKYPKASAYEAVAKDDASDIDLSWANLTKDNTYLFVTTDTDVTKVKPVVTPLAKQNTKLKISVSGTATADEISAKTAVGDADNGYLKLASDEKSNPDNITFDKMEYRTENGSSWTVVTHGTNGLDVKLKRYTAKGATLQLRVKAVDGASGNPAGKIFKVKVAAKAKAPKLTVNYLDQTVKFPKGTEYKIDNDSAWTAVSDDFAKTAKTMTTDLGYSGSAAMKISVRTKGTEKKASSKITVVNLPASINAPTATVARTNTVKPIETVGSVSIDYVVPYDVDKGIQVRNNSEETLQFAIVKRTATGLSSAGDVMQDKVGELGIADKKKVKWTNVSAATFEGEGDNKKVKKPGVAKVTKIDDKKISQVTADEYFVIYRLADKKKTVISKITAVALPEAVEQTIAVTGDNNNTLTDSETVQEATVSADKILTVEFTNFVSDKSKYTVTAFKAKTETSGNNTKYVKADDKKVSDIKGTVADRKLTIKATAKAQGNYILNVKREGAEFNVPVHVFKPTTATITADNTVSAVIVDDESMATAVIGKDKKSVVVTSKAKVDSVKVTLTVAAPTDQEPNNTTTVEKTVKIDADGNITVS